MTNIRSYEDWVGRSVFDRDGGKVGKIDTIYYDTVTGQPEWLGVNTGMFGGKNTFVPMSGATVYKDSDLQVPYTSEFIKDTPSWVDPDTDHLSSEETRGLFDYYDLNMSAQDRASIYGERDRFDKDYEYRRFEDDTSTRTGPPGTEHREETMEEVPVREERVTKEQVQTTARLKRYITTEYVPVSHEEVRLETDPTEKPSGQQTTTTGRTGTTSTRRDA